MAGLLISAAASSKEELLEQLWQAVSLSNLTMDECRGPVLETLRRMDELPRVEIVPDPD